MTVHLDGLGGALVFKAGEVEAVDGATGEIFAAVSLGTVERLGALAGRMAPCEVGKCSSASCALGRAVLSWVGDHRAGRR